MALPPFPTSRATTASALALLPAKFTTTEAPSAAKCSEMEAPIPFEAPVTTAIFPLSLFIAVLLSCLSTSICSRLGETKKLVCFWFSAEPPVASSCAGRTARRSQGRGVVGRGEANPRRRAPFCYPLGDDGRAAGCWEEASVPPPPPCARSPVSFLAVPDLEAELLDIVLRESERNPIQGATV